jgi:hypothetical protein
LRIALPQRYNTFSNIQIYLHYFRKYFHFRKFLTIFVVMETIQQPFKVRSVVGEEFYAYFRSDFYAATGVIRYELEQSIKNQEGKYKQVLFASKRTRSNILVAIPTESTELPKHEVLTDLQGVFEVEVEGIWHRVQMAADYADTHKLVADYVRKTISRGSFSNVIALETKTKRKKILLLKVPSKSKSSFFAAI